VKFSGKNHDYYGWVQSDRLADLSDSPNTNDVTDASAPIPVPAVCATIRDYYQATLLEGRKLAAPFESRGYHTVDAPKGFVPAHDFKGGERPQIFEVTINGSPAKLVDVSDMGMCVPQYTEVWSADLHKYLGTPAGARRGSLAVIDGNTYMLSGDSNRTEIIGFHSDLSSFPVCAITLQPRRPEQVSFAANAALCDAVRQGNVEDVGLSEITPIRVDPLSLGATWNFQPVSLELFRRGPVDLANNGHVDLVAMARGGAGPVGCAREAQILEWPVVLNEKGLPNIDAPVNRHTQDAGGEQARLIRYKGRIDVESRSSGGWRDSHQVSEVLPDSVKRMCSFTPVRYTVEKGAPFPDPDY
jgi:hypothetical protein